MRDDTGFGVIAIVNGSQTGLPVQTYGIGTVARIVDFDQGNDGLLNIVIHGDERFRLLDNSVQDDNLLLSRLSNLDNVAELAILEAFRYLTNLLDKTISNAEVIQTPGPVPSTAAQLTYGLAHYLPLTVRAKVGILQVDKPLDLLKRVSNDVRLLEGDHIRT